MSIENNSDNENIEQESLNKCWGNKLLDLFQTYGLKIIITIFFIIFSILVSIFLGLFSGLYLKSSRFTLYNTNIFHQITFIAILYGANIGIITKLWKSQKRIVIIFELFMPIIYILVPYIIFLLFFKSLYIDT